MQMVDYSIVHYFVHLQLCEADFFLLVVWSDEAKDFAQLVLKLREAIYFRSIFLLYFL